jgi:hypothetical protein
VWCGVPHGGEERAEAKVELEHRQDPFRPGLANKHAWRSSWRIEVNHFRTPHQVPSSMDPRQDANVPGTNRVLEAVGTDRPTGTEVYQLQFAYFVSSSSTASDSACAESDTGKICLCSCTLSTWLPYSSILHLSTATPPCQCIEESPKKGYAARFGRPSNLLAPCSVLLVPLSRVPSLAWPPLTSPTCGQPPAQSSS